MGRTTTSVPNPRFQKPVKKRRSAQLKSRPHSARGSLTMKPIPLYGNTVWELGQSNRATPALTADPVGDLGRTTRPATRRRETRRRRLVAARESKNSFNFVIGVANLIAFELVFFIALWSAWYGIESLA